MASKAYKIIENAQRIIPELPEYRAFDLLQSVHLDLAMLVPEAFMPDLPQTVSFSAGDLTSALPSTIHQVTYVEFGGKRLYETSVASLDDREAQWRSTIGTPTHYYVIGSPEGLILGLYPSPDASGNATVRGVYVPEVSRSSTLAGGMHSDLPYVYGIAYRAAVEFRPAMAQTYQQLFLSELDAARSFARSSAEGYSGPSSNQRNEPKQLS